MLIFFIVLNSLLFFFLQKISSCISTANIYVIFFISSSRQCPEHRTDEKYNLEIRRSGQTQQEMPHTPKAQIAYNDNCQRGRKTRFTPKDSPRIHRRTSRSFFYKRSQAVFRQRISTSYFSSIRLVSTLNTEPMKNTT